MDAITSTVPVRAPRTGHGQREGLDLSPNRLPRRIEPGAVYANVDPAAPIVSPGWSREDQQVVIIYDGRNDFEAVMLANDWATDGATVRVCLLCPPELDHVPQGWRPFGVPRAKAYGYDADRARWTPTSSLIRAITQLVNEDGTRGVRRHHLE